MTSKKRRVSLRDALGWVPSLIALAIALTAIVVFTHTLACDPSVGGPWIACKTIA
jgi:hypothetical protein